MPWATPTTDDVFSEFSDAEKKSLTGSNTQGANPIPSLQTILDNVAKSVRGSVRAGGNMVGPDGTVPDQLWLDVIAIARWRWLSSAPMLKSFKSPDREKLYTDAMTTLRDVASGKVKIELPTDLTSLTQQSAVPVNQVEVATHGRRKTVCFDSSGRARDQMEGLL